MNPNDLINPSFSGEYNESEFWSTSSDGLTKREWLVGMIASGALAQPKFQSLEVEASICIDFADEIIRQMSEGKDD